MFAVFTVVDGRSPSAGTLDGGRNFSGDENAADVCESLSWIGCIGGDAGRPPQNITYVPGDAFRRDADELPSSPTSTAVPRARSVTTSSRIASIAVEQRAD